MDDVETLGDLPDALPPRNHNAPPMSELLAEEAAPLAMRRDELLASVSRAPASIGDDETAGKVADLIKLIMACAKNAEAARIARKEPFLESGRLVDAVYKKITEPLAEAKRKVEAKLTAWQRAKAEEERRRREEEARRQAEEAERQRREAEARAAVLTTEEELAAAITAEAMAQEAEADAIKARQAAEAKPAELSRTRADLGAVASLRTEWTFADLDRAALDLETLRPHLALDAMEKAVRAFIRTGGRELRGVRIYETTHTVVR